MTIEQRLGELGITLAAPSAPAANYVPYVMSGTMLSISGQLPFLVDGSLHAPGKLGQDFDVDAGREAARLCGLAILSQAKAAVGGDWSKIERLVKLVGFVNSTSDFIEQPKVINGASDLMVDVFGETGRHARSAVSANSLPFGVPVEIEAMFALRA